MILTLGAANLVVEAPSATPVVDHGAGSRAGPGAERTESPMNVKKVMIVVFVALALFYVITQPGQAAGMVQGILGWLRDGAEAIITFLKNVFA